MKRLPLIGAGLILAGCAAAGPPHRGFGPGPHGPGGPGFGPEGPPGRPQLFISPAGKPYRAGPAEPYPVAVWFAAADADGDGRLSPAEFRADADAFFTSLDRDGDGVLDGIETAAYEQVVAPEILRDAQFPGGARPRGGRGGPPGGGMPGGPPGGGMGGGPPGGGMGGGMGGGPPGGGMGGGEGGPGRGGGHGEFQSKLKDGGGAPRMPLERPRGAAQYSFVGAPEPVRAADANLDFRVSREEFAAAAAARFAKLDADRKGFLTLETLPETPAQLRR